MKDFPASVIAAVSSNPSNSAKLSPSIKSSHSRKASSEALKSNATGEDDDEGDDLDFQDAVEFDNSQVNALDAAGMDGEETVAKLLQSLQVDRFNSVSTTSADSGEAVDGAAGTNSSKLKSRKSMFGLGNNSRFSKKEMALMKSEASDEGLLEDIVEVEKALELFLNSRFKDAEELLMPKYGKSMYFTEGIALLRTLRAVMTFDPDDMSVAIESLGYASDVAGVLRKTEKTSVMGMLSGAASIVTGSNKDSSYLTGMSRVQKHAELVYAECSVMQSSLTLVSNTNLVSFVKEGMQMRASFAVIKACFKFLDKIYEEEGVEGYAAHSIDEHFTSGVVMNAGILALVLSFLPAKIIKVFEIMGFAGDRDIALDRLSTSAEWSFTPSIFVTANSKSKFRRCFPTPHDRTGTSGGLRKSFSELILFSYHIILASLNPLPDTNLPLASAKLDACLANRSESFIYRALKARMLETQARPKEAEAEYAAVVALQRDYQQLYHACLWDMGICRMAQMKWAEAFEGYSVLFEESQWTRTVYRYTQAVTLYSLDPKDPRIVDMMKEVPGLVRKIAGITVPLEKFVSRKSKKFLRQGNRLLFPAYEILYFFHGLVMMGRDSLCTVVDQATAALNDLEAQRLTFIGQGGGEGVGPYETFSDDFCLALFIRAVALRELGYPTAKTYHEVKDQVTLGQSYKSRISKAPNSVTNASDAASEEAVAYLTRSIADFKALVVESPKVTLDHWILLFGRYELGSLYLRVGEYDLARLELDAAQNKGVADGETAEHKAVKKASMESMLQVRCHNALLKLRALEETALSVS
ncbi:hypothetical protein CcCBS67573_g09618 [Chytriomyces confervae]|uniref:Tetratricopeptide repeat protein 39B n=1 Tax=Chytriomyces confervae TaxID=246404 RepID=A0A507DTA0_9FUNG|nr:hypothetical protein CcCBS67573_g09618 [Chytriomyces confervae]